MDIRTLEIEIFFPVKDYEYKYEISNFGNVRKISSGTRVNLKKTICRDGYLKVHLNSGTKVTGFLIHRLMGKSIIGEEETKERKLINHKDGIKANNIISNLEWCTPSENIIHAQSIGLKTYKKGVESNNSKLNVKQLELISICLQKDVPQKIIAEAFDVSQSTISNIKRRKHYK